MGLCGGKAGRNTKNDDNNRSRITNTFVAEKITDNIPTKYKGVWPVTV